MRISTSWVVTVFLAGISPALAQPMDPPAGDQPPPPPPPPEPVPAVGVDASGGVAVAPTPPPVDQPPPAPVLTVPKGVVEDANSGRSWIMPTALTAPAGTWSFSDFELLMVSGSYAATDELSVGLTTLLPVVEGMPRWLMGNGKLKVLTAGQLHVALQGTLNYASIAVTTTDSMGNRMEERSGAFVGTVGGAATFCIDVDCYSHVTGFLATGFAFEDQSALPFIGGGSLAFKMAKYIKILLEADTGFVVGDINENVNGFLGWYGVRFTSRNIGVDLGFAKPVSFDGDLDSPLPMGVPFVSFTYRSLKGD